MAQRRDLLLACINKAIDLLQRRPIICLGIVFLIGLFSLLGFIRHTSNELIEAAAIHNAEIRAVALQELRTLYTSEVVSRASTFGMQVTHDYEHNPNAIPLRQPSACCSANASGSASRGQRLTCTARTPGTRTS
jgi:hypothetical protein